MNHKCVKREKRVNERVTQDCQSSIPTVNHGTMFAVLLTFLSPSTTSITAAGRTIRRHIKNNRFAVLYFEEPFSTFKTIAINNKNLIGTIHIQEMRWFRCCRG